MLTLPHNSTTEEGLKTEDRPKLPFVRCHTEVPLVFGKLKRICCWVRQLIYSSGSHCIENKTDVKNAIRFWAEARKLLCEPFLSSCTSRKKVERALAILLYLYLKARFAFFIRVLCCELARTRNIFCIYFLFHDYCVSISTQFRTGTWTVRNEAEQVNVFVSPSWCTSIKQKSWNFTN